MNMDKISFILALTMDGTFLTPKELADEFRDHFLRILHRAIDIITRDEKIPDDVRDQMAHYEQELFGQEPQLQLVEYAR